MTVNVANDRHQRVEVPVSLVDSDVHPYLTVHDVVEYIPEPWRSRYFRGDPADVEMLCPIYNVPGHVYRTDTWTPSGSAPGADPEFVERQLLGDVGIDFAILLSQVFPRTKHGQRELESALCSALNAWLEDTWLSRSHGRFRGSIRVSASDTAGAVAEIDRWAGHEGIVQVQLIPEVEASYGQPQFRPLIEAAVRANLPVGLHVFRQPGMRSLTPVGFPTYHVEIMAQWPLYFMSQLASFIFDGVFDRYPTLRFVGIEAGFGWVAPFFWRLDRYWEALGREASGAQRRPSDYLAENIRFTTQPVEEPADRKALTEMIEWLEATGGERVLLFSSDYPHYDYDDPTWVIPRLPKSSRERILAKNALEIYGLPAVRPVDSIDEAAGRTGEGTGS